ncbi:hypothetical protein D1BOALGB6SA_4242 [Olavius sp. associated proteobacterium Delta 1]|nr:hypothetical protein D1BOALGB6SA_4242 [Olavius sp. associated proteobacterium Delta 1]
MRLSAASIKFAIKNRSHNQVNWLFPDNRKNLFFNILNRYEIRPPDLFEFSG